MIDSPTEVNGYLRNCIISYRAGDEPTVCKLDGYVIVPLDVYQGLIQRTTIPNVFLGPATHLVRLPDMEVRRESPPEPKE